MDPNVAAAFMARYGAMPPDLGAVSSMGAQASAPPEGFGLDQDTRDRIMKGAQDGALKGLFKKKAPAEAALPEDGLKADIVGPTNSSGMA